MVRTSSRWALAILLVTAACGAGAIDAAAQDAPLVTARYRPLLTFRTISVGRFDIHFHQGEEALATRLAQIVREVAPAVEARYGTPRGRVQIVLVDQTDVSNGWATVVPYNLIELAAVPPRSTSIIGNIDDWLRTVFAHEYTHVVHLDRSPGLYSALRKIFGRIPVAFPNLFLPDWQIEGLATYEESRITGRGRVRAPDVRMLLDTAAASGRFAPLDRATGALLDWPDGHAPYLYGAYFHEYLSRRFGPESIDRLASETAARLPFLGSLAFKEVFGRSLGVLWREFEADTRRGADASAAAGGPVRLTRHGFETTAPAFTADGRLFYSMADLHGFPSLMELRDGGPARVATRYGGERLAAHGDLLVFDGLELADQTALLSDLYALDLTRGETRRLTKDARAADPDVSADGTVVCTVQQAGRRILATFRIPPPGTLGVPVPLVEADDTEFYTPRWSPDGRSVVAERRRLNGSSEIVVIDAGTREVRTLVRADGARHVTPAWSADGAHVLLASDRGGSPFRLYSADIRTGALRRLDAAGVGVSHPAVSPDGGRLVFVGYSPDGYDLYDLPLAAAAWTDVPGSARPASGMSRAPADRPVVQPQEYSPLPTLAPGFWIPYVERDGDDTVLGAATAGFDALGRHTYAATAGWGFRRQRGDLQLDYSYTRWRPALFASLSDDTDTFRAGHIRSREIVTGVLWPFRQVRWASSLLGSVSVSRDDFEAAAPGVPVPRDRRRTALRAGWSLSHARAYGYSISAEEGASLNVVSEFAWGAGAAGDGRARSLVTEARVYRRAWPRHGVIAARGGVALSRGDERVRRVFDAGGSDPQRGGFDVGLDAIGLLRGFDDGELVGRSAAVANIDYRIPLAYPQRGWGTVPVFVRAVHAAAFFDVGHAWDDAFRRADLRRSTGVELSVDAVLGSRIAVTFTGGLAWRHDPRRSTSTTGFVRIGRAF